MSSALRSRKRAPELRYGTDTAESEDEENRVLVEAPFSILWTVIPVLSGLAGLALAVVPNDLINMAPNDDLKISLRCFAACCGLVAMSAAVPNVFIQQTIDSKHFQTMLGSIDEHDPDFLEAFLEDIAMLLQNSMADVVMMVVLYAVVAWFSNTGTVATAVAACAGASISMVAGVQMRFCRLLLKLCSRDVSLFIEERLPQNQSVDWHLAMKEHRSLALRTELLWAEDKGAMVIVPLVGRQLLYGCATLLLGVRCEKVSHKVASYIVGAVHLARGVWTLKGPAELTERFNGSSPRMDREDIVATVLTFSTQEKMTEEEEMAHVKFLAYLRETETGVKLFGVTVTQRLIATFAARLAMRFGTVVTVLQGMFETG